MYSWFILKVHVLHNIIKKKTTKKLLLRIRFRIKTKQKSSKIWPCKYIVHSILILLDVFGVIVIWFQCVLHSVVWILVPLLLCFDFTKILIISLLEPLLKLACFNHMLCPLLAMLSHFNFQVIPPKLQYGFWNKCMTHVDIPGHCEEFCYDLCHLITSIVLSQSIKQSFNR